MDIDLKDKKILLELDLNSRQSYSIIAKKVNLSKEVVNYRITKLVQEGIITNFTCIIDYSRLGVIAFRTFLRLCNLDKTKEEEIINYLKKTSQVGWGVTIIGRWDINFIFWCRDIYEFTTFWGQFYIKFGEHIENKSTTITDWYYIYPKAFILPKYLTEIPVYNYYKKNFEDQNIKLDKTDFKILSILAKNSRARIIDIAKEVNLSETTVLSRIKDFERKKIILAYNIGIDINKIGYNYFKLHMNYKDFNLKRYNDLLGYCQYQENIWSATHLIGGDDIEIDVYIEDEERYMKFLNDIRSKFSDIIKNYETINYHKEFKYNLFPIDIK
ncbi:MAG: Lrp/AsnC family transcriptional regulator [archaeon]|jgi:DNA-binding Lrp family transcriptional regulator